jgi:hypothetical protein
MKSSKGLNQISSINIIFENLKKIEEKKKEAKNMKKKNRHLFFKKIIFLFFNLKNI